MLLITEHDDDDDDEFGDQSRLVKE